MHVATIIKVPTFKDWLKAYVSPETSPLACVLLSSHEQLGGSRHRGGAVLGLTGVGFLPSEHAKGASQKGTGGVCQGVFMMMDCGF